MVSLSSLSHSPYSLTPLSPPALVLLLMCYLAGWFSSCVPDAEDTRDGVKLVIKV
jgi:hypothetical protein